MVLRNRDGTVETSYGRWTNMRAFWVDGLKKFNETMRERRAKKARRGKISFFKRKEEEKKISGSRGRRMTIIKAMKAKEEKKRSSKRKKRKSSSKKESSSSSSSSSSSTSTSYPMPYLYSMAAGWYKNNAKPGLCSAKPK